jgi:hypothetical protein
MKTQRLVLILGFLLPSSLQAQTAAPLSLFSPRVGAEIDAYERTYFNLFPKVPRQGFAAARITAHPDDTYQIDFVFEQGRTAPPPLQLSRYQLNTLNDYIDRFEHHNRTSGKQTDWNALRNLARFTTRYDASRTISGITPEGAAFSGTLLVATSNTLALLPSVKTYHWQDTPTRLTLLDPNRIDDLVVSRTLASRALHANLLPASVLGFYAAGRPSAPTTRQIPSLGITLYNAVRAGLLGYRRTNRLFVQGQPDAIVTLSRRTAFGDMPPAELLNLLATATAPPPPSPAFPRWHIALGTAHLMDASNTYEGTISQIRNTDPVSGSTQALPTASLDVAYALTRRTQVGLDLSFTLPPEREHGVERMAGGVGSLYGDFVVRPANPYGLKSVDRFSLRLGGGLSLVRIQTTFGVERDQLSPALFNLIPELATTELEQPSTLTGISPYLRGTLDYLLTPRNALFLRVSSRPIAFSVPESFLAFKLGNSTNSVYRVQPHDVTVGRLEVAYGLRWRW